MNAFRTALVFSAPWLLLCALWCGVSSRRVVTRLVMAVLISGAVLAVYSVGARVSGEMLTSQAAAAASPLGPFLYQNQGGAYFYLLLFLAGAFGLRLSFESGRLSGLGGPQWLAVAAVVPLFAAVLASRSFGAAMVLVAGLCVLVPCVFTAYRRQRSEISGAGKSVAPASVAVALLLALLVIAVVVGGDFAGMVEKVKSKLELARSATLDDRRGLREATWAMYNESGSRFFGMGAGAYRWVAPDFLARVPGLADPAGRYVSHAYYAHNDWLQMLAEWGALGFGVIITGAFFVLRGITRTVFSENHLWRIPVLGAAALVFLHACMDYLLFNPSIGILLSLLLFLLLQPSSRRGTVAAAS